MTLIRPITEQDLGALVEMARESGVGVTSLPDNPELMERKVRRAVASFRQELAPEEAHYIFILQDTPDGPPVGLCGIEARIGRDEVWYNYRLGEVIQASKALGLYRRTPTLFLSNDLTGATEIGSLFLREPWRGNRTGAVLSKCRFLFLAAFPDLFSERVIAEMRGNSDEQGNSPFWEGLGKRFFSMEFSDADFLTGSGDKVFIAELMPKFPIYVPMLPPAAQQVIATVHPRTEGALAMLRAEGFRANGYVDIFDAGPTLECSLGQIGGVQRSELLHVRIRHADGADNGNDRDLKPQWLVSNERFSDFRVISTAAITRHGSELELDPDQAGQLQVVAGDPVRLLQLQPEES
ncbi:MAG: arginine N-succinyltransferase [Pseudohongiellaceae bacterium]